MNRYRLSESFFFTGLRKENLVSFYKSDCQFPEGYTFANYICNFLTNKCPGTKNHVNFLGFSQGNKNNRKEQENIKNK